LKTKNTVFVEPQALLHALLWSVPVAFVFSSPLRTALDSDGWWTGRRIVSLTGLRHLSLASNKLNGNIPDAFSMMQVGPVGRNVDV
jgi:hypothetical protein